MKKFAAISLSMFMMITNVFADANVTVKLNDEQVEFSNQQPVIVEGRTLIPLRSIFENLGYTVEWQADTKTAVLKSDTATVTITANAEEFDVNGNKIPLDTPAQILNGSMMLPLRAIGEASGLSVGWDNDTKVVSLNVGANEDNADKKNDITVNAEMESFYNNLVATYSLQVYYDVIQVGFEETMNFMEENYNSKTFSPKKAIDKLDNLNKIIDGIQNEVNTLKVPDDFKSAKSSLLNIINDYKRGIEIYKNMYSDVYPDEKSAQDDIDGHLDEIKTHLSLYGVEMGKLNNQYERVMYKYFDTEKASDEDKSVIADFCNSIKKIADKYPVPDRDAFGEEVFEKDKVDENLVKIKDVIKNRAEAYKEINVPDKCKERFELIICSNDALEKFVEAVEKCDGNYDFYNPDFSKVIVYMEIYDSISQMASDNEMGKFYADDDNDIEFEKHIDESFTSIQVDSVSKETQDFVNNCYYDTLINEFLKRNDSLNDLYSLYLNFDDETIKTGRSAKEFFSDWRDAQDYSLSILKNLTVSETIMPLKSAAINYINYDIEYTNLMQKFFSKQIAEDRYEAESEELSKKIDAAENAFKSESGRIESLMDNYMYDYLDYDMVRTENAEATEFGKKIIEINEKYPVEITDGYSLVLAEENQTFTASDIKSIYNKYDKALENIKKREEEYKNIEYSENCKKRMELILAADELIEDYVANNKNLKANDENSYNTHNIIAFAREDCFENLVYLATNGAEPESDSDTEK